MKLFARFFLCITPFPLVVVSDIKCVCCSGFLLWYKMRKMCWLGLMLFFKYAWDRKTIFFHPRKYIYWKYLLSSCELSYGRAAAGTTGVFQMQYCPEQDQQEVLLVLFSPLASVHSPLGYVRSCSSVTESPRKWKLSLWLFLGREERYIVWHVALIVLGGDVQASWGQEYFLWFWLAVSQILLYSWTWRQDWGKGMDVPPVLTLNSDDDSSFLGNNAYEDGRLKCC